MALVDEGAMAGVEVLEHEAALGLAVLDERVMVVDVSGLQWRRTRVTVRKTRTTPGPLTSTGVTGCQNVPGASPGWTVTTNLV